VLFAFFGKNQDTSIRREFQKTKLNNPNTTWLFLDLFSISSSSLKQ
jgi:hypothetical protein